MHPDLFKLFDVAFPSYFVLLLTGFLFATAVGALWARRIGQNPDSVVDLGLSCIIWGVIGGRILHVLADGYFWDYVHLWTDPTRVVWPNISVSPTMSLILSGDSRTPSSGRSCPITSRVARPYPAPCATPT